MLLSLSNIFLPNFVLYAPTDTVSSRPGFPIARESQGKEKSGNFVEGKRKTACNLSDCGTVVVILFRARSTMIDELPVSYVIWIGFLLFILSLLN